jgi:hypothetical protein
MIKSQSTPIIAVLGLGLAFTSAARADSVREASAALVDARSSLWSMINAKDKSAQDALNAKVQTASTKLDSVLAGMTSPDAKLATDSKVVWDQFKATCDSEIIPAIHKGNAKDARKIADGVQADRLAKMWDIMSCKVR